MPDSEKYSKNRITIYVSNVQEFKKSRDEIREMWYKTYGVSLSIGEILLTCLQYTKNGLNKKTDSLLEKNSNSHIMFKYARLGQ